MWLAPFTAGQPHLVYVSFEEHVNISVLRIWVCIASSVHSPNNEKGPPPILDGLVMMY